MCDGMQGEGGSGGDNGKSAGQKCHSESKSEVKQSVLFLFFHLDIPSSFRRFLCVSALLFAQWICHIVSPAWRQLTLTPRHVAR